MEEEGEAGDPVRGAAQAVSRAGARAGQDRGDQGVRREGEDDERLEVRQVGQQRGRQEDGPGARRVLPQRVVRRERAVGQDAVPVEVQAPHLPRDPAVAEQGEAVVREEEQHPRAGGEPGEGQGEETVSADGVHHVGS